MYEIFGYCCLVILVGPFVVLAILVFVDFIVKTFGGDAHP